MKHTTILLGLVSTLIAALAGCSSSEEAVDSTIAQSVDERVDESADALTTMVCQDVAEGGTATFTCPAGSYLYAFQNATYGNGTGTCGEAIYHGTCDSANSYSTLENACLGRNSCSVAVNNTSFGGDPCPGTAKRLKAIAWCKVTSCQDVAEGATATFTCPANHQITGFNFASYGNASGSCSTKFTTGTCNSSTSSSVLNTACVGKSSCTVTANNATFGEPCSGTAKRLKAQAICEEIPTTCQDVPSMTVSKFTCPAGQKITGFSYASYGNATGSCSTSFTNGTCNSVYSRSMLNANCLGKNSCEVPAYNSVFTDPCPGTAKTLKAKATCGNDTQVLAGTCFAKMDALRVDDPAATVIAQNYNYVASPSGSYGPTLGDCAWHEGLNDSTLGAHWDFINSHTTSTDSRLSHCVGGAGAQNECLNWGTSGQTDQQVVENCVQAWYNEGPGTGSAHGHYNNMMTNTNVKMSCGVYKNASGALSIAADFRP